MPDSQLHVTSPADETEPPERTVRVSVTNETDAQVDERRLEAAVRAAFSDSPYDDASVSVAVVDDAAIHALNRQFLEHDYPTDVLSFPLEDDPPRLEGEIVVSVDTAERCAADAGWTRDEELLLYVVHGALHLAGFDDNAPANAMAMRRREAAVLARLGVQITAQDSRWQAAAEEDERS
jgi:probable rRNA maturation factor